MPVCKRRESKWTKNGFPLQKNLFLMGPAMHSEIKYFYLIKGPVEMLLREKQAQSNKLMCGKWNSLVKTTNENTSSRSGTNKFHNHFQ